MKWKLGDKHPHYGEVIAMGIREGEAYRFFKNKDCVISLIPLLVLELESRPVKPIILDNNPVSIASYIEEFGDIFK